MDDTSLLMKQKMQQLIQAKSPEQRLMMGCTMFDFSKQLVTRAILIDNPNLNLSQLRAEVFLKFYGNDFTDKDKQKIVHHLNTTG